MSETEFTVPQSPTAQSFVSLDPPVAARILGDVYGSLAGQPDSERLEALRGMAKDEYGLSDGDLREFTQRRLMAWLEMGADEARIIASDYERVMSEMPASTAMRRVAVVQSVMGRLEPADQEHLRALLPESVAGPRLGVRNVSHYQAAEERTPPARKRWAFWRSSPRVVDEVT